VDWYYAVSGERLGPVDEPTFRGLVANGTITPNTLVWNADLPDWKRWGDLAPAPSAADIALGRYRPIAADPDGPASIVCVECADEFPEEECVKINGLWVCAACKPVAVLRFKQDSPMHGTVEYAGFAPRFFAKLIDYAVVGALGALPQILIMRLASGTGESTPEEANFAIMIGGMAAGVLQLPITLAYGTYFVGRFGGTVGKLVMHLRVVDADLQPVTYPRALGRAAAELITGFTCSIGYLMCLYDDQRRNLHDHIAATRVIRDDGDR